MKALAGLIMRGRFQAALVAAATALLSLLLPLFGLLSSATLALATLRNGAREGALVGALSALGVALVGALTLGSVWPALAILLILWLPLWGLGWVLRQTRSLSVTVLAAGLAAVALVLLAHALIPDPAARWLELMAPVREALVSDGVVDAGAADALFAAVARWMTGTFAAALVLQWLLALFIGRWWQAQLYNPGGFGQEFRDLRLHRGLGIAGIGLLAWIGFNKGPGLLPDLLVALMPLYLLQGLAVIHQLHRARGGHVGWLVGLYALMVFFMPNAELLVACVGLVDIWADIRARFAQRSTGAG